MTNDQVDVTLRGTAFENSVIVHHKLLRVLSSYFVHVLKWDVILSHSHLVVESGRVSHLSPELAGWLVLVVSALRI